MAWMALEEVGADDDDVGSGEMLLALVDSEPSFQHWYYSHCYPSRIVDCIHQKPWVQYHHHYYY